MPDSTVARRDGNRDGNIETSAGRTRRTVPESQGVEPIASRCPVPLRYLTFFGFLFGDRVQSDMNPVETDLNQIHDMPLRRPVKKPLSIAGQFSGMYVASLAHGEVYIRVKIEINLVIHSFFVYPAGRSVPRMNETMQAS